ncbi:MAG: prepilin-type N-terminal cleavage/methylation domain-containing protein [Xanthomonadales bacterium]|nr:prepilin-type N-terminal cleavage/methylation domain-containing protein [Xanthomonadales bacterium]
MNRKQSGFTLVEIAIVLVIIGLLLGGILKGQELINSARVRNLADTASGVQAAYFGFLDRYRRVPGDWDQASATTAIGTAVTNPTADTNTNNGRIDNPGTAVWKEPNAMWEQLAKAGFIQGSYAGTNAVPTQSNGLAPLNAFNAPMVVGRTADYQVSAGTAATRLHLVTGRLIPVKVLRELDLNVDDSQPRTRTHRAVINTATVFTGTPAWGGHDTTCVDGTTTPPSWNVTGDSQDCNAVILF